MVTAVETRSDVVDMLNDLIQLAYAAVHTYEAAIGRIDNSDHKRQLAKFKDDHERHTRDLDHLVRQLHGKPVNGAVIRPIVSAGEIAFADLTGDKTVLKAMKSAEDGTNKAYERAASRSDLPHVAVPVIEKALGDERRHCDWLEKTIAAS